MNAKNKGRGSVERIVQTLQVNKEQTQGNTTGPARDTHQTSQATTSTETEPVLATQQAPQLTTITIPDSPPTANTIPVTIMIESDTDCNQMPEDPILEDNPSHQEFPTKGSTRIDNNEINISKEHSLSDDDRSKTHEQQTYSPRSHYSTAPSEIPHRLAQEQSPISSLDPDDIDQLNTIFDNHLSKMLKRGECGTEVPRQGNQGSRTIINTDNLHILLYYQPIRVICSFS